MYDLVNFCEIDEDASKAYCAVHNVSAEKNLKDVTQVDFGTIKGVTMLFGGSPCQDFSLAGRQAGVQCTCNTCGYTYNPMEYAINMRKHCPECNSSDITRTRSSLLQYFIDALLETKPKIAIYENVEMLLSSKFTSVLKQFQFDLESMGYYYETICLNCEDFNIPQHRKRVFIVFMHNSIACTFTQNLRYPVVDRLATLHDYLDFEDTKHIHCSEFVATRFAMYDSKFDKCYCGTTLGAENTRFGTRDKVCHENGVVCTLTASDWKQPRAVLVNTEKYLHFVNGVDKVDPKDIWLINSKEMFRLMGFSDSDYKKIQDTGIKRNALYRVAGNSISVNVLFYLFKALYLSNPKIFDNIHVLSLFSGVGAFEKALTLFLYAVRHADTDVENIEFPFDYKTRLL